MRVGHAIGVGGASIASQFGVDGRAALLRMFQLFEDHHSGSFANYEAVAGKIEGSACRARVVVALRQGSEPIESSDAERMEHAVSAAGGHHVRVVGPNQF